MEAHWCCSAQVSPLLYALCGLALACWNNSLCRSITCMRWGWRISSLYLTVVTLPGTCTRSVLRSFEIVAHTMTLPPPKLSTSWTQEEEKRSFRRLYTRILPSRFCSRKRDSSLNQIIRQFGNVQPPYLLHQRTLSPFHIRVTASIPLRNTAFWV